MKMMNKKNRITQNMILAISITAFLLTACSDFINKSRSTSDRNNILTTKPDSESENNPFDINFVEPTELEFSEKNLLLNVGLNVISPLAKSFLQELQILNLRLSQSCSSASSSSSSINFSELQNQFSKVIDNYHQLDGLAVGPLSDLNPLTNNRLSSLLYSWPRTNTCEVDRVVAFLSTSKQLPEKIAFNAAGLDAVEYLLFASTDKVSCPNFTSVLNQPLRPWLEQTRAIKEKNRCETALKLTDNLINYAQELDSAWDRNKKNFSKTLVDNSRFAQTKQALNALTNALYFLESVKDDRLGIPLGKHKDCDSDKCIEKIEHSISNLSLLSIKSRLKAFKKGFFGDEIFEKNKHGFDDLLIQAGRPEISEQIKALVTNAENQISVIENLMLTQQLTFKNLIENVDLNQCSQTTTTNRIDPVCTLFEDIRIITSTLKTEVLIALSLEAPPTYQGDND